MSPLLKTRVSGAWVDSDRVGAARVAGAWVPFGPAGGPDLEDITWPDPPSSTDLDDGDAYTMGIRFSLAEVKPIYGITWRVPDSVITPAGGQHVATLWAVADESLLATINFTPVPGGEQQILFSVPYTPVATPVQYVAAVHTRKYVFRNGAGVWPSSPSGNVITDQGKLVVSNNPAVYPGGTFGTPWYYVSPLVEV